MVNKTDASAGKVNNTSCSYISCTVPPRKGVSIYYYVKFLIQLYLPSTQFRVTCTLLLHQAHGLQLEAFALALTRLDPHFPKPKLQFVGSCRNKEDLERLQKLKDRAFELHIDELVEFHKDISYMYVFNIVQIVLHYACSLLDGNLTCMFMYLQGIGTASWRCHCWASFNDR